MAAPKFVDVWILESNTVYQEVPYTVVCDWLTQGRLLGEDKARNSGTKEWFPLGTLESFTPFFPKSESVAANDQVEAMDHVELDFHYKHTHDDDDDDVDMIPLIDVSLVLLVFFMISAGSAGMSSPVPAPEAENGLMADNPDSLRIDIKRDKDGSPLFSLALGTAPPTEDERDMISQAEVLDRLKTRLQNITTTEMVVNADKDLRAKIPRDLLTELRKEPYRSKIRVNYLGVSEKQQ